MNKVAGVARQYLQEFQRARQCPTKKVRPRRPQWKPPDAGYIKTNFDGAIFEDLHAAGIGVVIRDEHGEVIAALAGKIPIPDSVLTLKLWRLGKRFNLFKNLAFVIPSLRATPHLPLMLLVMDN